MTTASTETLGDIHNQLAATYKRMIAPREEVMVVKGEVILDEDGNPRTYTVYPSAAELAAANAFLKNNNITATPAGNNALSELAELMAKRKAVRPVLADPFAHLPDGRLN